MGKLVRPQVHWSASPLKGINFYKSNLGLTLFLEAFKIEWQNEINLSRKHLNFYQIS